MKSFICLCLIVLASATTMTQQQITLGKPQVITSSTNLDDTLKKLSIDNVKIDTTAKVKDVSPEATGQLNTASPIKINLSDPQVKVTTWSTMDGYIKVKPEVIVIPVNQHSNDPEFHILPYYGDEKIDEQLHILPYYGDEDECEESEEGEYHILPYYGDEEVDEQLHILPYYGDEDEDECEESEGEYHILPYYGDEEVDEQLHILPYYGDEDSDLVFIDPIPAGPVLVDPVVLPHPSTPVVLPNPIRRPYKQVRCYDDSSSSDDSQTITLKIEVTEGSSSDSSSSSDSESHHYHVKSAYLRRH